MIRRRFVVASILAGPAAAMARPLRHVPPAPIPPGYVAMGRRYGVPPQVLYGVALQESALAFGARTLPYPWTLNVEGQPRRYGSYEQAVAALQSQLDRGISRVDCGLMQVCWRYHHDRLRSVRAALDPYPNIGVGAQLLAEHFEATHGDWFSAVGRYHNEADLARATQYAREVFRRIAVIPTRALAASEGAHG